MSAEKELTPTKQWKGSMNEAETKKGFDPCVTDAETFAKLWKAWKVEGDLPKLDFTKNLVVTVTTVGSVLNLRLSLDDMGDLKVSGMATRDLRPGFRYVLAVVPKEGVKTVNGKVLEAK